MRRFISVFVLVAALGAPVFAEPPRPEQVASVSVPSSAAPTLEPTVMRQAPRTRSLAVAYPEVMPAFGYRGVVGFLLAVRQHVAFAASEVPSE